MFRSSEMVGENVLAWFGSAHHRPKQRGFGRGRRFRCQVGLVTDWESKPRLGGSNGRRQEPSARHTHRLAFIRRAQHAIWGAKAVSQAYLTSTHASTTRSSVRIEDTTIHAPDSLQRADEFLDTTGYGAEMWIFFVR